MNNQKTKPEFITLFEAHGKEIHVYLWRMLQNTEDAEDCLQETFLRAYKSYDRIHDYSHLRAWLYKIATNTARTYFKKRQKHEHGELSPHLPDKTSAVSDQVETKMTFLAVQAEVEKLPAKQQAALILHKYQMLSYKEIAVALKCNEDTARANVYQAVKKLRKLFPAEEYVYG